VRLHWLAHDEAPGPYITIPQHCFDTNKATLTTLGRRRGEEERLRVVKCAIVEGKNEDIVVLPFQGLTLENGSPQVSYLRPP